MGGTLTIARLTLHEARRRKILLAVLVFGLAFLLLFATGLYFINRSLPQQGPAVAQRRFILNSIVMAGLYAVNFLTIMTAVLVPVDTLSGEIGSGVIQTLVSKPMRRSAIVLGKWLGFWTVLTLYLGLMTGGLLVAARAISHFSPPGVPVGLPLMWLEGTLLMTLSIAGGTRLSTIANGITIFGLYGLAFIGGWMEQIGTLAGNATARYLGIAASLAIPCESLWQLAAYHMQPSLIRDLQLSPFSPASVPSNHMVVWAAVYTVAALGFALWQFQKRNL
jgi:ABC-type transport system involved in multi-copper enzyme maturation permease subunit